MVRFTEITPMMAQIRWTLPFRAGKIAAMAIKGRVNASSFATTVVSGVNARMEDTARITARTAVMTEANTVQRLPAGVSVTEIVFFAMHAGTAERSVPAMVNITRSTNNGDGLK